MDTSPITSDEEGDTYQRSIQQESVYSSDCDLGVKCDYINRLNKLADIGNPSAPKPARSGSSPERSNNLAITTFKNKTGRKKQNRCRTHNAGKKLAPTMYHHSGNTKKYYKTQRHFSLSEDKLIAELVVNLAKEVGLVNVRENYPPDLVDEFLKHVKSDKWNFFKDGQMSLLERFNKAQRNNQKKPRSGWSLKGRWKKLVSYVISEVKLLFDFKTQEDLKLFIYLANTYHSNIKKLRVNH